MRAAKLSLASLLLLLSCRNPNPDFQFALPSQDGKYAVTVKGFQPRGTIDGLVLLSFSMNDHIAPDVATIHHITEGVIGWTTDGKVAVVGNNLDYQEISSAYAPDGTIDSEIKLVLCSRDEMDCSSLEERIIKGTSSKAISRFPES